MTEEEILFYMEWKDYINFRIENDFKTNDLS